jgi:phospholipid/cholesterol/gamma-HCH transport system substrate-binding protein
VDVGNVQSIEFDPEDRALILIRIGVRAGTPITRGTVAQLGTQGVTGLSYVKLEDDGSRPEDLAPSSDKASRIPMRPSFLDELAGSGKDLLGEFTQVAQRLNALLSQENQALLTRTLASLETEVGRVGALAAAFGPVVSRLPELTDDARKALARADTLLASIDTLTQELTRRVDTLERVARSAEQVGGAAHSASQAVTAESLPRMNALLDELARNSRNLERLINDLNDQPNSLVFGRAPAAPGPGEPGFNPAPR